MDDLSAPRPRGTDAELAATAAELGRKVDRLTDAVDRLDKSHNQLATRTGAVERRSVRTVVASVLAVAILVIGGWLAYTQVVTNSRLDAVVTDQQKVTQQVLCPVFALLLGGYDPETRPPGEARVRYVETFEEYSRIFARLECTTELVPPRQGG